MTPSSPHSACAFDAGRDRTYIAWYARRQKVVSFIAERYARGVVEAVDKTVRVGVIQRVVVLALKEESSSFELFRLLYLATKVMDESLEAVRFASRNDETILSTALVGIYLARAKNNWTFLAPLNPSNSNMTAMFQRIYMYVEVIASEIIYASFHPLI